MVVFCHCGFAKSRPTANDGHRGSPFDELRDIRRRLDALYERAASTNWFAKEIGDLRVRVAKLQKPLAA